VVFSKTRKREILFARQLIMYYSAHKFKLASYSSVGALCGNKDHATVSHSIAVINNYLDDNIIVDKEKREKILFYDKTLLLTQDVVNILNKYNFLFNNIEIELNNITNLINRTNSNINELIGASKYIETTMTQIKDAERNIYELKAEINNLKL